MTFTTSTTPDVTEAIPASLSQRVTAVMTATREIRFDVLVNGLGFCLDPDSPNSGNNGPYVRQTTPVRKQQTDISDEAGEQTLDGYWIRSQASWHGGAGIQFYEPGAEEETKNRFYESSGVDVWTPGKVTPLHKMTNVQSTAGACFLGDAGNGVVAFLSDTAILGWSSGSAPYSLNSPAAGHTGRYYFFGYKNYYKVGWTSPANATIGVWAGNPNTVVAKNATVEPHLWYCKDRLIVSHGPNLFEVPPLTAVPVDLSDTTVAIHKPQDTNTTWVDVVEGPSAILAGYTGGIVRFALQDATSGSTPKLSQAYRVLELPTGETLKAMFGYLGRFLVLSTSAGIRVCAISNDGGLQMGQVMVPATAGDFRAFSANGDFVYCAGATVPDPAGSGGANLPSWGTSTGLLAINLGTVIGSADALRFAYALDERSTVTTTASGSITIGSTKYLAITGSGVWKTHADYVSSGYVAMGRYRFNSLSRKAFRSIDIDGAIGSGTIRVDMLTESDVLSTSVSMNSVTGLIDSIGLDLTHTFTHMRPVAYLTWTSGVAPTLTMVQVRALPQPGRIRQVRYPLRCFDREQDRNGQAFGRDNFSYERLKLLEELEESAVPVTIVDNRVGESYTAVIDDIQFASQVAPDRASPNFSGLLTLTLTKIT